jgi:hypothetical protein
MMSNKQPFTYKAKNGNFFSAKQCDFNEPIFAHYPQKDGDGISRPIGFDTKGLTPLEISEILIEDGQQKLMADVAEMIGYHAINVLPKLKDFQGYDSLHFIICRNCEQ